MTIPNLDVHQPAQWTLKGPALVSVQTRKFLLERVAVERNKALMGCLSDHLDWKLSVKFKEHVILISF